MAVGGAGGLLGQLLNPGLDDRLATHLTPNPNPLFQQGQGAQPGTVDSLGNPSPSAPPSGSNLAPPASTQPDPVNNSYIADLLAAQRRDANAATFNQGLDQMAASFGTAQQQQSKQAKLQNDGTVGGGLGDLAKMQAMQDQTITDNEHARFMGSAATFAQTLSQQLGRPVSVQEAQMIQNNPELMKSFATATGANATTTGTQKDAEAATREWANAHPKATPQDIADYKANLIAGGMGGSDLEQRQYLQEKSNGITTDDFATWKAKKAAQATTLNQQAKDSQEFKDTATQDYTANNSKLTSIQSYIDTLTKDPAAAQEAMKMFTPTTGKWGAINPLLPQNVANAAVALQKIQAQLTAEGLSGVKNVRNAREFNTLGQAATGGLNAAASPGDFAKAISDLQNKFLDAQATNELAVGHKLTGNLVGHGASDLLSPTRSDGTPNPYYNGGSEDGQKLEGDDLVQVQQALAQHPEKREQILDQVRKNGYTPRGL